MGVTHVYSVDSWREGDAPADDVPADDRDLAYLIYTSGSTGVPKGAMIQRGGLSHLLVALEPYYWARSPASDDGGDVRSGITSNYTFDMFAMTVFGCLCVLGGTCVLLPNSLTLISPDAPQGLTHLMEVPSVVAAMESLPLRARHVLMGGEALTTPALERVPPTAYVGNAYGPTEMTICTHCRRATLERITSIGRPLVGVSCHIVDTLSQRLPIGVWGEMWLGGPQLGRGYLNRPELTASRFVAVDAAWGDAGAVYRTGDCARWLHDGEVELRGRIDLQVKLRGLRVELEEVETALRKHPAVHDAIAAVHGDALVGYVVPPSAVVHGTLADDLARALPAYMVPTRWIGVDEWPRSLSGKINRAALPVPEVRQAEGEVTSPRTDDERAILEAMSSVLSRPVGDVYACFLAAGGTSLRAAQLARRLSVAFGRRIDAGDVLRARTCAQLAVVAREPECRWRPVLDGSSQPHDILWVCLHDYTGHLAAFRDVARLCAPAHRCMGVSCSETILRSCATMHDLARAYWKEIGERTRGARTLRLLCYSLGCQVGCHVAALAAQEGGCRVEMIMIDGLSPGYYGEKDAARLALPTPSDNVERLLLQLASRDACSAHRVVPSPTARTVFLGRHGGHDAPSWVTDVRRVPGDHSDILR